MGGHYGDAGSGLQGAGTGTGMTRRRKPRRMRRWLLLLFGLWLASLAPVLLLRFVDPPTSAFMLARHWEARGDADFRLHWRWVDWEQVSPQLPIALVAAEDQKFPQHRGFDLDAISSALGEGGADGPSRGASTISQQVAKNLFLWQGRSWLRKAIEAYYTLAIELIWPKQRILEVYLNIAEFGDGVYGAEAAAQRYFNIPASRLDAGQSALLAAVLPNPKRYRVEAPSPYVLQRRVWIQRQVRQLGGPAWLEACCGEPGATR